jgi:hypothetical protein
MAWRSRTLNMRHLDYHDTELQRHMCFHKPTSERSCEGGTLNQLSEWGVPQLRHYTCELHGPAGLISPMVASCRKRSEGTQLPLQVVGCTAPPLLPSSNLRTRRQYVLCSMYRIKAKLSASTLMQRLGVSISTFYRPHQQGAASCITVYQEDFRQSSKV